MSPAVHLPQGLTAAARRQEKVEVYLHPGEYAVGDARYVMRTLLGSCVSITLWHPQRRIGAMSHFLLWSRRRGTAKGFDGRFGEEAMALMLNELERRNIEPRECQAKIFGGATMFSGVERPESLDIGRQNGEAARGVLRAYGIAVKSESLFGHGHRKIVFDVGSGHVWSRQARLVDPGLPALEALQ
jgi:chemotaxis protein CheD